MKEMPGLIVCVLLLFHASGFAQNLILNGDFENDLQNWVPIEDARVSSTPVRAGGKALCAVDSAKTRYAYVYQEMALDFDQHEVIYWVYPASIPFFSAFEFLANWQNAQPIQFISRVLMRDSTMSFTAMEATETLPNLLAQNSWNKITIHFDKSSLRQDFFVNDSLVSSLTASAFPTAEHLLVGDLSLTGMYGTVYFDEISVSVRTATALIDVTAGPATLHLAPNFPNPFNPATRISYHTAEPGRVRLQIFDLHGKAIRTLVNTLQLAGAHTVDWDGLDTDGRRAASGVYVYRLRTESGSLTRKMTLLK